MSYKSATSTRQATCRMFSRDVSQIRNEPVASIRLRPFGTATVVAVMLVAQFAHAQDGDDARQSSQPRIQSDGADSANGVYDNPWTSTQTLQHVGIRRHFLLHLPKGEKPRRPAPLVLVLHGAYINGTIAQAVTQFSSIADEEEFIVVYPNANPTGRIGIWDFLSPAVAEEDRNDGRMTSGRDDVGFIAALIDRLVEEKTVDPAHVYVTGISNGAYLANRLSIDLADRIAAIAPVAGTLPKSMTTSRSPTTAMPIIYFHGVNDRINGIDGTSFVSSRKLSLSADKFCTWMAKRNGCAANPKRDTVPDIDTSDGCTAERLTWKPLSDAAGSAPVVFYRIDGGGHTWPGNFKDQPVGILGKTCRDLEASRLIWDFFQKHKR